MYNEFLRFIYNKKRYGFDSFSDGLYLVIFLCATHKLPNCTGILTGEIKAAQSKNNSAE